MKNKAKTNPIQTGRQKRKMERLWQLQFIADSDIIVELKSKSIGISLISVELETLK